MKRYRYVHGVRNPGGIVIILLLVTDGHFDTTEIPPFRMGMEPNIEICWNSLTNTSGLVCLLTVIIL
jgi:hypothetical protein